MEINFSDIKNALSAGLHFVAEKTGVLANHTVKVLKVGGSYLATGYEFTAERVGHLGSRISDILKPALNFLGQNLGVTVVTIIAANILLFETSLLISRVFNRILPKFKEDSCLDNAKTLLLLAIASSILVGSNLVLAKGLESAVTPFAYGAISGASCSSYILVRLVIACIKQPLAAKKPT